MPQLRDSGTRAAHESNGTPAAELNGFERIFGVETEYGVAVTGTSGARGPVDAGQVAMTMFQPVVSRARSTNTYLDNGSRLYLDVGSHPEYATAEARDPLDALAQDMAGERIMASLAAQAQERLRASHGDHAAIHVFKNNVDSAGHAFGCHENYLVRRIVPLETIERQLLPFLITRQLYTGAGRFTPDGTGFQLTQRADFLDEAVSSATTRSRPMVNTRDEPHADPESFRRLHVIIGDSNRSHWATWMKLAVTHLVLCVIEDAVRRGTPSGFEDLAFDDPAAANRAVSRWLDGGAGADAGTAGAGSDVADPAGALAMQRRYLGVVESFVRDHADAMNASLPKTPVTLVLDHWRWVLDALERRDIAELSKRVDWAAKYRLAEALRRRRPDVGFAQLERMELDYHDVANGRLYGSLVSHGQLDEAVDPALTVAGAGSGTGAEAADPRHTPPQDTRAALRGAFVRRALDAGVQFSCDWTTLVVSSPVRREATLLDPFSAEPTPEYRALMAQIGN
ncbi:Pup--protein ligase [Bifidobacterium callitrichos]|uniref:Pup--protein ligase n=2 Tax=Bifidobacterium TaxID=1678 RepID=A0A2T3GA91_9BIFI|nr:proteasome accessory factor PafA2 family protein [Bifidobacterium callitrichos]PST46393.1 Pup--protein ligase [Bifidobacterium callitrichos]